MTFFLIHTVVCIVAWMRGGTPERIAAVLLETAMIVSYLLVGSKATIFASVEWGLFGTDLALLLSLVALAVSADRYWPMWLASLQMVSVWMHPAFGLAEKKVAFAYAVASIFWSYPMMIILVVGAIRHHRRSSLGRSSA